MIAMVNIQTTLLSDQSPAAEVTTPSVLISAGL
jgi:hypothetical protein